MSGDNPTERNRGRFIREAVGSEIMDKGLKGPAVYGSGHRECRGMGMGELRDKYPGRIWAASSFYDVEEGRRVFDLGPMLKAFRCFARYLRSGVSIQVSRIMDGNSLSKYFGMAHPLAFCSQPS
jgi:hypothetical protein